MPDRSPSDSSPVESAGYAPEFLKTYDRLRAPFDERGQFDNRRRVSRLIRRRRPWRSLLDDDDPVREQRPAPLLELRAASAEDAEAVTGMLEEHSGNDPVAVLSRCESRGEAAPPHAESTAYEKVRRTEEDVAALVDELRRRRGRRIDGPRRRSVRPLEFPRTRSLLDLFAVYGRTYREWYGEEDEEYAGLHRDHRNPLVVVEALWWKAREGREARRAASEREEERTGEGQENGEPRRRPLRRIGGSVRKALDDVVGVVGKGYTGLYLGTSRLLQLLGVGRTDTGLTFDRFDRWVITPLGVLIDFLLGLSLLLGVQSIVPDPESAQRVLTVLLLLLLVLLRALLHLGLSQPWQPYRWLVRQPYLPEGAPASRHHRTVTQHVGETYRRLRVAHAEGNRRALHDQARDLRLLLVNAVLEDLAEVYPEHRYRTGFHRPALVADRYATRWRGGEDSPERDADLVRLIERVRAEQYAPDPLVVVEVVADPAPLADRETGSAARELTAWADRRRRVARLGPSRTVSVDIGPDAAERARRRGQVRGAARTEPTAAQRWKDAALAAGVATAVLLLLAGTVGVLDQANSRKGNDCWRPLVTEPGIRGAERKGGGSRDCVGYTDGSFVFHAGLEEVQKFIEEENGKVVSGDKPYVTVVYFGQLSFNENDSRIAGVRGELMGLALRQREHNENPPQGVPRIRLLIANAGYRWEHGTEVAERIGRRIRAENIVAAVGFGQSLTTTRETIKELSKYALPMVSSTATHDRIAVLNETTGEEADRKQGSSLYSDFFFPVAPSNSRLAEQTADWVMGGKVGKDAEDIEKVLAVAYTAGPEIYGRHLADAFLKALEKSGYSGERGLVDYDGEQKRPESVVDDICAADPRPDLVYYAGRSADFGSIFGGLDDHKDCLREVTVLASDDVAQYVAGGAEEFRGRGISVYYTPLAMAETAKGRFLEEMGGFFKEMEEGDGEEAEEPAGEPDGGAEEETYGLIKEMEGSGVSIAHATMAYDALYVVDTALKNAVTRLPGPLDRPEEFPALLLPRIQEIEGLAGASGNLDFGSDGGHWYEEKLVLLARADGEGPPQLVAACGPITNGREPDPRENGCGEPEVPGAEGPGGE